MRKRVAVIVLVALAIAALVVTMMRRGRRPESSGVERESLRPVVAGRAADRPADSRIRRSASVPNPSRTKPVFDADEDDDELPPAERALKDRIEKALEDEDLKAALHCVDAVRGCTNVEIRQAMVDALGWFGKSALPELTPFLADGDEDVRESACNEWSTAVSDIEDEREKIAAVEMAMNILSDEDFLEDISSEYVGIDEKIAVESLMRIIADGKSEQGVAKAKETYEFVTGDEWQNADEARRWLAEEYAPPDPGE